MYAPQRQGASPFPIYYCTVALLGGPTTQGHPVLAAAPPAAWAVRSGGARDQTGTAWCRPRLLQGALVLTLVARGLHAVPPEFTTCSIRAARNYTSIQYKTMECINSTHFYVCQTFP